MCGADRNGMPPARIASRKTIRAALVGMEEGALPAADETARQSGTRHRVKNTDTLRAWVLELGAGSGAPDRDPFDNVPRDLPPPPVIDPCGPWVSVSGKVLHFLQRHVLLQQVRYRRHSERMWREVTGESGGFEPPLHHPTDVDFRAVDRPSS